MKFRFGFALTTALGNLTRYTNLRKYAERDEESECVWAPITHYLDPDPYRKYPSFIHHHLILKHQVAPVLQQWQNLDAVVVHAFQLFSYLTLKNLVRNKPLLVLNQDYGPFRNIDMLANYGQQVKDNWRRKLRYMTEVWFARRADIYILWSEWARNIFINDCDVPKEKTHVVHPGVDLELWPYIEKPAYSMDKPHILFVGGDFDRKGGDILLDVYFRHFSNIAHLDLVTRRPPQGIASENIRVYTDLGPNDPRLQQLYAQCDVFVLPTKADMSSMVSIEAMATGRPVISTPVGGIPDIVKDGKNGFLINPGDGAMLKERLQLLLGDPHLRGEMGREGRRLVEHEFNAELCAARVLSILKEAVKSR